MNLKGRPPFEIWYYILSGIVVVSSSYCILHNLWFEGYIGEYTNISKPLNINPNFFAIPVVLVLFYFSWEWFQKPLNGFGKTWRVLLISFCAVFLILLTSRMAFFSLFVALMLLGIYYLIDKKKYFPILMLSALFFVLIIALSQTHLGGIRLRNIKKHINVIVDDPLKVKRIQTMDAGFEILKENLWLGAGFHEFQPKLQKIYSKKRYDYALQKKYHIHNQFLQIGARGGVLLLIVFLGFLWLPIILKFNFFACIQSTIFSLVFITDSPLMDLRITIVFIISCGMIWYPLIRDKFSI